MLPRTWVLSAATAVSLARGPDLCLLLVVIVAVIVVVVVVVVVVVEEVVEVITSYRS